MRCIKKHYFAGGNTTKGFFNCFDNIISNKDAYHIYCIKGGPGVGKSTFMKSIANEFGKMGFSIDYFHCSSDNNSLDGVLLKESEILIVDGTAPHIYDPKYPGAVDTIINFGDFFDISKLKKHKNDIIKISEIISDHFKTAYKYLNAVEPIYDNLSNEYLKALNEEKFSTVLNGLLQEIFTDKKGSGYKERKLFLSAVTPDGFVNFINETIDAKTVYILNSAVGDAGIKILNGIISECKKLRLRIERFPCVIKPDLKTDHIIIPELDIAIITSNKYHSFSKDAINIDLSKCYYSDRLSKEAIDYNKNLLDELFKKASYEISKAKAKHDILEDFYKNAMDFEKLSVFTDDFIKKI